MSLKISYCDIENWTHIIFALKIRWGFFSEYDLLSVRFRFASIGCKNGKTFHFEADNE